MPRFRSIIIVLGIALIVSVTLNVYHFLIGHGITALPEIAAVQQNKYPYLSPRLALSDRNDIYLNFSSLRQAIRTYVAAQPKPIYFYFEYLPSGSSIGVNEQEQIPTASLIKIPTVMAIYSKMEQKQLSPDQLLTVQKKHIDPGFGTFWKQGEGATITITDAIEKTIIDSDNTTFNLLDSLINPAEKADVFNQLDIVIIAKEQVAEPYISAKSYASILKSLYFSTYLSFESSQAILERMTRIADQSKLPAGIDPGIPIAHKIGVFEKTPGDYFYHDCGIVYHPNRRYILCVMVNGEEEEAQKHIRELSRMVYSFIKRIDLPYSNNP